jgi:hypothetical protein
MCVSVKGYETLNYEYEAHIKRMMETKIHILHIIILYINIL